MQGSPALPAQPMLGKGQQPQMTWIVDTFGEHTTSGDAKDYVPLLEQEVTRERDRSPEAERCRACAKGLRE